MQTLSLPRTKYYSARYTGKDLTFSRRDVVHNIRVRISPLGRVTATICYGYNWRPGASRRYYNMGVFSQDWGIIERRRP